MKLKHSKLTIFIVLLSGLVLHSCCYKKLILSIEDIKYLQINGFKNQTIDSVTILSYRAKTNYSELINSTTVIATRMGDNYYTAPLPETINPQKDYLIVIKSANKRFHISNIITNTADKPQWSLCNDKAAVSITSYTVNDSLISNPNLDYYLPISDNL